MGTIPWPMIIECVLALLAIVYYIRTLLKWTRGEEKDAIFARSSQLTFISFILCFSILLIRLNATSISAAETTAWVMLLFTVITVVNAFGVWYYQKQMKRQNKKEKK